MPVYYKDEWCTIYHGDTLEILPVSPCHVLITDPPFAFTGGISNGISSNVSDQAFRYWWRAVCEKMTQSVLPTGSGFLWCDWHSAHALAAGFEPMQNTYDHWRVAQMLFHYREMPGLGTPFRSSVDMIAYIRGPKHKATIPNTTHNFISKYWYYGKHDYHPAEKSLSIAEMLIGWCGTKGGIILDPFMGSGTTLVAAKSCGYKAVGIEIEERYCEIAAKRLCQEVLPFPPLAQEKPDAPHPSPTQECPDAPGPHRAVVFCGTPQRP